MKLVYSAILLALLGACTGKSAPEPAYIIAQEKFVDVMVDVRLLEGAYSTRVTKPDTIKNQMSEFYNTIFAKHHITKEQFKSSYTYYLQQANTMANIEDAVIEKLNVLTAAEGTGAEINTTNGKDSLNSHNSADTATAAYKKPQ